MSNQPATEIAEDLHPDRSLRYRYSRYATPDKRWVRHGEFKAYYPNGTLASEGTYAHGREDGPWKDFHENGKLAAEGAYRAGKQHGAWRYFGEEGALEETVTYEDGVELKKPRRGKSKPAARAPEDARRPTV